MACRKRMKENESGIVKVGNKQCELTVHVSARGRVGVMAYKWEKENGKE